MINYTVYKLNKFNNLEDFINKINENRTYYRQSSPKYGLKKLKSEINGGNRNIEIMELAINDKSERYAFFDINIQGCKFDHDINEYIVVDSIVEVVSYERADYVGIVILQSYGNAQRVIKKIFADKEKWGEVNPDDQVNEDLLYWFFYRMRELPDKPILKEPLIYLNGIYSYLGRTEDKVNATRGVGKRVTALLGTLGMLLGEESLRALRPIIQYEKEELNIELYIGNSGKVYENTYSGALSIDIREMGVNDKAKLFILVCKYILPGIISGYNKDKDKNEWSIKLKQFFLRGIGNEIREKVDGEIERIDSEIMQYEEIENDEIYDEDCEIAGVEQEIEEGIEEC